MNNKIFNYINPKDNYNFSSMSGNDLQDFLILLDNYFIEYRDSLNLTNNTTFGLELEFSKAKREIISEWLKTQKLDSSWKMKHDLSLFLGSEIASPIMHDTSSNWDDLEKICNFVKSNACIDKYCGGHIHVGAHILDANKRKWLNFILLWIAYENIIFRFTFGDYLSVREGALKYAKPMAGYFKKEFDNLLNKTNDTQDLLRLLSFDRRQAVNMINAYINMGYYNRYSINNTIEFRCPNGSLDPIIWQNNVNMFVRLLYYANSSNFDINLIDNRLNTNDYIYDMNNYDTLDIYGDIFIEQALEFCDIIYDNNLDKLNFLKQYFKSLQVNTNFKNFIKTKKMTK